MCGISGIFSPNSGSLQDSVARMTAQMEHRGPDGEGVWVDADAGIALGHRRLAVLDLSEAGRQPMSSSSGRWVIVLNGEIYNHLEIRRQIEAGYSHDVWRGHSDTETLVAAIERWGFQDALVRLRGMFAIAAWDRAERCLWLTRDRMGEKPLYYGWVNGSFVFASELRPIRAIANGSGLTVSPDALSLLTSLNYIPAPRSIYQEVNKLLPGTFVRVPSPESSTIQVEEYWKFPSQRAGSELASGGLDAHVDLVDTVLKQAVRHQMLADVPLGALLSGGIDSSLIVAMMQAQSTARVKTFTIGFDEAFADESLHARRIAEYLGTDHHEMVVTASAALEQIPRLPSLLDEPMGDSSQIPTMCVMGLARQHVTVALSGDGADELFGGYGRYRSVPRGWNAMRWMPNFALNGLERSVEYGVWDRLAKVGGGRAKAPLRILRYYAPRMAKARSARDLYVATLMQWMGRSIVQGVGSPVILVQEAVGRVSPKSIIPFMMEADALTYLPDDVLVKVDRAAMSHSLETRAPFLDRDVVELSSKMPLNSKLEEGRGKVVLQHCLARYLPRQMFERPKQGFSIPLDAWLRGPLREWADALLDPKRIDDEGYLHAEPIRCVWARHQAGKVNAGHQLWSVLMFQAWLADSQQRRAL